MAWLVTVVARARLVTLFGNVVFAPALASQNHLTIVTEHRHTNFGMYEQACRDILEQDVRCFRKSCIRGTLVAGAVDLVSHSHYDLATYTYLFFAVADTMAWLITEKALDAW
jgi:hypothetical protein